MSPLSTTLPTFHSVPYACWLVEERLLTCRAWSPFTVRNREKDGLSAQEHLTFTVGSSMSRQGVFSLLMFTWATE